MVTCDVKFPKNPTGKFQSGEIVHGVVVINNDELRMIRGFLLRLEGFARTKWTEETGSGSDSSTTYSAKETYLDTRNYIIGNGKDEFELLPGQHTLDFEFTLPLTIPSTFKGKYGEIQYQIQIVMDRKMKFNYTFNFPLIVAGYLDLNTLDSTIALPLRAEKSKSFFLGLGRGSLNISAEIPLRGYARGQNLSIDVSFKNTSSVDVTGIVIELHRKCLFKCDSSATKTDAKLLLRGQQVNVGLKKNNQICFSFEIPTGELTSVTHSKYIHINYEIFVNFQVVGAHRNPILVLPITIGSVALGNFWELEGLRDV